MRLARSRNAGTAESVAESRNAALAGQPAATIASTRRAGGSTAISQRKLAIIVVSRTPVVTMPPTPCNRKRKNQNGAAVSRATRSNRTPDPAPPTAHSPSATVVVAMPPQGAGRIQASAGRTIATPIRVNGWSART